jgi:hypothetical protein
MDEENGEANAVHHEINVRERCQQFGINIDNAKYRTGIDRFKWMSLLCLLTLKNDYALMSDDMTVFYFESIIPKIPFVEVKNPLACVLMMYITFVVPDLGTFLFDHTRFHEVATRIATRAEFLFRDHGLHPEDLVRYTRLFTSIFSSSSSSSSSPYDAWHIKLLV